jgi:catechol 2,3-dioxygenase-like lactoylglutathione lyase family enzyme
MATTTVLRPPLHHVNLKTTRPDAMIAFYRDVVGVEVVFRNDFVAFTSNDDAHHRIVFITLDGMHDDPEKIPHTGMHHMAFDYGSLEELIGTYERLRDRGILPHMSVDHRMATALYYPDPDGNTVELQVDNFPTQREAQDFMRHAPEFAADPLGVYFDPELVAGEIAAGATSHEIHVRALAGAYENEVTAAYDPRMPVPGGVPS